MSSRYSSALALFLLSGACLSVLDASGKWVVTSSGLLLLLWFRFSGQILMALAMGLRKEGLTLFHTHRPGLQLLRSVLLIVTSLLFFAGVQYLPLAEASAIAFTGPLWVVLLSWKLLQEPVNSVDRWATYLGFAGILFIVRPGTEVFHPAALLLLGMAIANALYQLLTRRLTSDSALTTFFYSGLVGFAITTGLLFVLPIPTNLPLIVWPVLLLVGLLGGLGHVLMIQAFYQAPASSLSPFVYLQLIWATSLGWLIFNQLPDRLTFVGMGIIALSGSIIVVYRRYANTRATSADAARSDPTPVRPED
ncbi:MAG: DMT family transporter [Burkholderiaceae bacterium]